MAETTAALGAAEEPDAAAQGADAGQAADPAQTPLWDDGPLVEVEVAPVAEDEAGTPASDEDEGDLEPEPDALDWHSRRLLSQLYHAVEAHLEQSGEEPSTELLIILGQVRAELQG